MTNISDEGDRSGTTNTKLVTAHDRGARDWARRRGEANSGTAPEQQQTDGQTVDEVVADVDAGNITAQEALDAERAGKNRSTLISQLESRGAS